MPPHFREIDLHVSRRLDRSPTRRPEARYLYAPWLDVSARRLQEAFSQQIGDLRRLTTGVEGESDTCTLFVDGLRFDLGGLLREKLKYRSSKVQLSHRIALWVPVR